MNGPRFVSERVWRGHYRILVDDVFIGEVRMTPGHGWIASPVRPEPSPDHCEAEAHAYRGSLRESTAWMLDYSGLPMSIADALTYGWDLDEEQVEWVAKFLRGMG